MSRGSSWKDQYSVLEQNDRDDPLALLRDVCTRDFLMVQRNNIYEFYRAAIQSPAWEHDDPEEKSQMFFYCMTTVQLWEVAYRICELLNNGELVVTYKTPR